MRTLRMFAAPARAGRRRNRRGAVIVEFALVVPFVALIVFGVIDFSRAYGQLNVLDSAMREGARYGSRWKDYAVGDYATAVKTKMQDYANTYGFSGLDLSKVSVTATTSSPGKYELITVTVTAHPITLPVLNRFLGVPNLSLTRTVSYRWECAGLTAAACVFVFTAVA